MKTLLTFLLSLVLLGFVIVFVGGSFLGKGIVAGVERLGPEITRTTVELEAADLSLLSGRASLSGLLIGNPEGFKSPHLARLGELAIDMVPMSLVGEKIVIEEIVIESPEFIYELGLKGTNLGVLLANVEEYVGSSESEEEEGAASELRLEIGRITFANAKVTLASDLLGGEGLVVAIPSIEVTDIGTRPEGATVGDVLKRVMAAVNKETANAVKNPDGSLGNGLESVKEKVGGLLKGFKKK